MSIQTTFYVKAYIFNLEENERYKVSLKRFNNTTCLHKYSDLHKLDCTIVSKTTF